MIERNNMWKTLKPEHVEALEKCLSKEEFDKTWDKIYPQLEGSQISKCCQQLKEIYDCAWEVSEKEQWTINFNCSECKNGWIFNYEIKKHGNK